MTLDEFLQELETCRDHFYWSLMPDARKVTEDRAKVRFHIRGSSRNHAGMEVVYDAIGAVCYMRTGFACAPQRWAEASHLIGLPADLAEDIVNASNDQTWVDREGIREPDSRLQLLRDELIRIVLLEAPVDSLPC